MSRHATGYQAIVKYETYGDSPGRFLLKTIAGVGNERALEREVEPEEILPLITFLGPGAEEWLRDSIRDHLARCVDQLERERQRVIEQTRSLADRERDACSTLARAEEWHAKLAALGEVTP